MNDETVETKAEFTVAVEFLPPTAPSSDVLMQRITQYLELGVKVVSICSNPMGKPRLPALYVADVMGPVFRRIVHYPCAGRSSIIFRSDMMQAVSMGVDSVLVLAGDPCMECSKQPDLLSRIRTLKHEPYSSLMVGAAADPNLMDIGRLKDKRDAGADFFITQPVFDKSTLIGYLEATRSLEVPSFIGIMVPHSRAQMDSLNRITGVKITDEYLANFAGIQNEGAFSAIAVAKAIELIKLCRDLGCSGVYVSVAPSQIRYLKELVNNGE